MFKLDISAGQVHLAVDSWSLSQYRKFLQAVDELKQIHTGRRISANVDHKNKTVRRLLKKHGFEYDYSIWTTKDMIVDSWSIRVEE